MPKFFWGPLPRPHPVDAFGASIRVQDPPFYISKYATVYSDCSALHYTLIYDCDYDFIMSATVEYVRKNLSSFSGLPT